jgi:hypothetical protein
MLNSVESAIGSSLDQQASSRSYGDRPKSDGTGAPNQRQAQAA